MDFDDDNVAETEKYAFLLGSAIKNEDTDQFFSIYDSILPQDLPDTQLEDIKQKARQIAELPEEDFNDLVFRARHFSLAPTGPTMSCRESTRTQWGQRISGQDEESEEDEGVGSAIGYPKLHSGKSDTSSLYSTTKVSTRSSESDTRRFEDDSGVCNSSKATNSIDSLSDQEGSDYEGRAIDYYPPQVKIRSGCGMNLDYDEAHEVKSETSSTQDVNSPRSDFSDGIEMENLTSRHCPDDDDDFTKFRRDLTPQNDFYTDDNSDDDDDQCRREYYKKGYRLLMPEREAEFRPSFSTKYLNDMPTSSLRSNDVDKAINFTGLKEGTSPYSRYSSYTSSSDRVRIEKNTYKRDPPLGNGPEQFSRVAQMVDSLISGQPDREVMNMPEGRKLEPLTPEENKKRKKKKKNIKDDATKDENGNPIVESASLKTYRQMRESPNTDGGLAGHNRLNSDNSYGTFNTDANREIEDGSNNKTEQRRKPRKKTNKEDVKRAEDVQNYQGNKPIEELIDFIGGQNASNKKSKKLPSSDIPGKTQKPSKKNKDKKQKSPTPLNSLDESETKGGNFAQPARLDEQGGVNNMGNLSGKTDVNIPVENGETDSIYVKKDKIKASTAKSLLKDNGKKIELPSQFIEVKHIGTDATKTLLNCKESVKEKDVSKTNNKREAVVVDISTSAENKKKSEKSIKVSSNTVSDKAEMPTPKPEDSVKVDTGLTSIATIKQKNAKNKKSKPSSPTVKTEPEVSSSGPNINETWITHPITSSDDNFIVDNNFIFTDLDVPDVPKEDEFQVVGKKKKKPTKEMGQQSSHTSSNGTNKQYRRFEEKRNVPTSYISNKIPNPSVIQSSPIESESHARDLSPSSFPALGGTKGRQSLQDGRRNSTGDVPIPSELKVQDDSDMESVKSLPAIQGGRSAEIIVSPRLNVSYAKMAASARPSSPTDNMCSMEGGDAEMDPKKAVWKGSPTERRHSIGSSPEGVNIASKNSNSVNSSAAASMKAGSQENIKGDLSLKINSNITLGKASNVCVIDRSGQSSSGERVSALEGNGGTGVEQDRNADTEPALDISSVSTSSPPERCQPDSCLAPSSLPNTQNEKQTKASCNDSEAKMNSISSISGNSNKSLTSNSSLNKLESIKNRTGVTNSKKQKSVIFLDKRVEETPGNLGISFGFEIEPAETNLNKAADISSCKENSNIIDNTSPSEVNSTVQSVSNSVSFLSEPEGPCLDNEIPSQKSSSSCVISDTKSPSQDAPDTSRPDEPNTSGKKVSVSQLVRLNGVVTSAQGQTAPDTSCKAASEDSSVTATSVVPAAGNGGSGTVEQTPATPTSPGVIVYYGESVATLKKDIVVASPTNGPTRYCGLVNFVQEKELKSNFNLVEAASFLIREWDRAIKSCEAESPN